jgi:molecular chaperone DnaK (HSP70)
VCRRAHVAPSDLDEVLVTGGQARAPYVRRRLEEFFQQPCVDLAPGAVVLGAAELGRRLDGQEAGFSVHETSPCSFGYGAPGGAFVPVAHRDARLPVSGEAFIDLPPGARPELLLFEGDHGRVEGCEPYARLRLDEVPEGREDTLRLQLNLRLDDRGTLALEVLRAATGTSVPHRLDPALSDEQVARSLAAPAEAAPEEPTEVGFLDWLKKKLRPL